MWRVKLLVGTLSLSFTVNQVVDRNFRGYQFLLTRSLSSITWIYMHSKEWWKHFSFKIHNNCNRAGQIRHVWLIFIILPTKKLYLKTSRAYIVNSKGQANVVSRWLFSVFQGVYQLFLITVITTQPYSMAHQKQLWKKLTHGRFTESNCLELYNVHNKYKKYVGAFIFILNKWCI